MPTVTNTIKRPDGSLATDAIVVIELVGENTRHVQGYVTAADYSVAGTYRPPVSTGTWSQSLVANSLINPSGTVWKVTENVDGITSTYTISVPNGAGPYFVEDILADPPAAIDDGAATAIAAHIAAHDAMGADYIVNVKDYGAMGDGATIDSTAITDAIAALNATNGKVLYFPPGVYLDTTRRSFNDTSNIAIVGENGRLDRETIDSIGDPLSEWRFTGTGSDPFITAKDSVGFSTNGIALRYSSASFTGALLDITATTSTPVYGVTLTNTLMGATPARITAAACVQMNGIVELLADNCTFAHAEDLIKCGTGVANYNNAVIFRACRFVDAGTNNVNMTSAAQWSFDGCVFEQSTDNEAAPIKASGVTQAISFTGSGFWDASAGTKPWIEATGTAHYSWSFTGCYFELSTGGVAFDFDSATGLAVIGTRIIGYGAAVANVFTIPSPLFSNFAYLANSHGASITDNSGSVS